MSVVGAKMHRLLLHLHIAETVVEVVFAGNSILVRIHLGLGLVNLEHIGRLCPNAVFHFILNKKKNISHDRPV